MHLLLHMESPKILSSIGAMLFKFLACLLINAYVQVRDSIY